MTAFEFILCMVIANFIYAGLKFIGIGIIKSWMRPLPHEAQIHIKKLEITFDPDEPGPACIACLHDKSEHFDYIVTELGPNFGQRVKGCRICRDKFVYEQNQCQGYTYEDSRVTRQ